jgi:hypothetical protein
MLATMSTLARITPFMTAALLASVALPGCSSDSAESPKASLDGGACAGVVVDPEACNGSAALCDRAFDAVSFPTTHNSMSNADDHWAAPNQEHGITRQLEDGVRGLMLDTHDDEGVASLCHAACGLGSEPLARGLGEIKSFLDCHPREIVTIIFESYISAAATEKAFEDSGLVDYVRTQAKGAPWPTLRELIDANERVVVFTDSEPGVPAWYMDEWQYTWQNPYAAESAADFSCDVDRGSIDNPIFIMNHFLTKPLAMPELAEQVNHNPLFLDRARQCQKETGKLPNFVTVDFYGIGDLFDVVKSLNGLP